ncbi:MAG: type VI secretion system tube protein Hcp [Thermodesulfobacteriota bacterium]|jgi:type VI secretion system secreted protein Hcp
MKRRFRISYWLVVFFSLGLLMVPASWVGAQVSAGQKIFVCIPSIPGESVDPDDPNCIVATSYSDGVSITGSAVGGVAGRPEFSPIQITKSLDKASPLLRQYAAEGRHISNVTIDIFRPGVPSPTSAAAPRDFLVLKVVLTQVLVTGVSMTINQSDLPKEVVNFDFARIQMTYHQQNADGTPVIFLYNLATGRGN